jgi:hypothetical protein
MDKSGRPGCQVVEIVEAYHLHIEALAGIHRKLVDDDLCELAVVDVGVPSRFASAVTQAVAEIVVSGLSTAIQNQADRNNEDGCKEIYESYVYISQCVDERRV